MLDSVNATSPGEIDAQRSIRAFFNN